MKTLTLELHDDQTFNGRITHDGRVIASVSGNVDLVTATGAVQEFAAVFGTIQKQAWHKTHSEITPWRITCLSVNGIASQWHLHLPGHSILSFGNEAAAISARAALRPIWAALIQPPTMLYESFLTDGSGWGFVCCDGLIHAGFGTREEAQSYADKRLDSNLQQDRPS